MTREEAINRLIYLMSDLNEFCNESKHMSDDDRKEMEALDMAIKALEQEPCEDAISRESIKKVAFDITTECDTESIHIDRLIYEIENLPPVTPTISEIDKFNDSVNRASVLSLISDVQSADGFKDYSQYEYLFDQVDKMPMATPTRKVGKWIYHEKSISTGFKTLRECSCCHCYFRWEMPRNSYCPNCGADMRESGGKNE